MKHRVKDFILGVTAEKGRGAWGGGEEERLLASPGLGWRLSGFLEPALCSSLALLVGGGGLLGRQEALDLHQWDMAHSSPVLWSLQKQLL